MSDQRLIMSEFWQEGTAGLCHRCGRVVTLWVNRFTQEGVCKRHFLTERGAEQSWERARERNRIRR